MKKKILLSFTFIFVPFMALSEGVSNPVNSINNLKALLCKDSKFKNECLRSVDSLIASSYAEGAKSMYCKLNSDTLQIKNDPILQEECRIAAEFIGNISENK